jgi:hypothetical protein
MVAYLSVEVVFHDVALYYCSSLYFFVKLVTLGTKTAIIMGETDHGIAEQNVAVNSTYVPDLDDKAMEKRIVRKIDMHILPFICISYLINYLDRACSIPHP